MQQTTRHIRKYNKAFSLIEMLVGLVVLLIAMTGLTALMIANTQGKKVATGTDEAATLAQSAIESYLNVAFATLGTDTTSPSSNGRSNGDIDSIGPLNRLGLTQAQGGAAPFLYRRHIVVCQNGMTIAEGSTPIICGASLSGNARPSQLTCGNPSLSTREKLIRTLVTWTDRNGRCKYISVDAMSFNWAGT